MRQLASIQRIIALDPIEGADLIEAASVLGWKVVVKKGEFQVGDLAVYMEIDSVPPDEPAYRFLWKHADMRPNNFRIKTIKLRGQISQGILFPISQEYLLGSGGKVTGGFIWGKDRYVVESDDVTDLLDVTKYEPPLLPNGGANIEGQFFDGVTKTDEERVQSAEGAKRLARLRGRAYYITEKLDGASMTVAMHDGVVKVASRNYRLADMSDSAYWNAARNSTLIDFVRSHHDIGINVSVQGELVGPGIQNNCLGLKQHECRVFNVCDRNENRFWSLAEMMQYDVINSDGVKTFGIPLVPIVEVGFLFNYDQEQLLRLAEGAYAGTNNEREGIVIRSNDGDRDRISFKVVSNSFLLHGGN